MTPGDLRIRDDVQRGARVRFSYDGMDVDACGGESVAAALWAAGVRQIASASDEAPPGRVLFCMMGVCQQCAVTIDDVRVEACRVTVRDGMVVRSGY